MENFPFWRREGSHGIYKQTKDVVSWKLICNKAHLGCGVFLAPYKIIFKLLQTTTSHPKNQRQKQALSSDSKGNKSFLGRSWLGGQGDGGVGSGWCKRKLASAHMPVSFHGEQKSTGLRGTGKRSTFLLHILGKGDTKCFQPHLPISRHGWHNNWRNSHPRFCSGKFLEKPTAYGIKDIRNITSLISRW